MLWRIVVITKSSFTEYYDEVVGGCRMTAVSRPQPQAHPRPAQPLRARRSDAHLLMMVTYCH